MARLRLRRCTGLRAFARIKIQQAAFWRRRGKHFLLRLLEQRWLACRQRWLDCLRCFHRGFRSWRRAVCISALQNKGMPLLAMLLPFKLALPGQACGSRCMLDISFSSVLLRPLVQVQHSKLRILNLLTGSSKVYLMAPTNRGWY